MGRNSELAKNTSILAIGKIGTQFISFFLLPVYTAVLSTEEYGLVDLFTTYVSLAVPLLSLQIDSAIFRFLIEYREDEKKKTNFIFSIIICVILQVIFAVTVYCIIQPFITLPHKEYLIINVVLVMISNVLLQIARGLGDNIGYSVASFVTAITTICFNIIFLISFHMKSEGMLLATCVGNAACDIYLLWRLKLRKYISSNCFSWSMLKAAFRYSVPLIPNTFSWWVLNASDRTIILHFMGVGANGIISVAHKFSTVVTTFYGIFNLAWTETAALHVKDLDSREYFEKMLESVFKFSSSICMGIVALMPFVFGILVNSEYSSAFYQIPIYMLAALLDILVSMYGSIYIANKKTMAIAQTSLIAAIVNIGINIGLIRYIGLYAVSLSTLIAYLIMFLIRYYDSRRYMVVKLRASVVIPQIVVHGIVLGIYYSEVIILQVIMLLAVIVFSIVTNWNIIKDIVVIIRNRMR